MGGGGSGSHAQARCSRPARSTGRPPFQVKTWFALAGLSAVIVGAMSLLHLPAAWLLGPLVAGALVATRGHHLKLPKPFAVLGQSLLGTYLATKLSPEVLGTIATRWAAFLFGGLGVVVISAALGWALTRWRVLPGSTAVWGTAPGAATAMVIMAEAFGADARLVALMQYLRVATVVLTSALVARVLGAVAPETPPFVLEPTGFALAMGVGLAGLAVGLRFRTLPAGALLVPMTLGVALPLLGHPLQLPAPVVALAATLLGWNIGLTFTRESLVRAAALLPKMLVSIVALMAACALVGLVLAKVLDLDLMTAWLATSPGGMDSLALIASASKQVDVPFVIAMQASRFLALVLVGPWLARTVARMAQR